MPKLCCFLHPEATEDAGRKLTDRCAVCGRPFDFTESSAPDMVGPFKVVQSLGRGFYSAAYVVESGSLRRKKVVKLAFKATYDHFRKDFKQECQVHDTIADGSEHIVKIDDMLLDQKVRFGSEEFHCHLAELDYVEGDKLSDVLSRANRLSARTIAQIAIDLFAILRELANHRVYHNDLNPDNLILQSLGKTSRRADAEDDSIRVVAIDLNSVTDASKSDAQAQRLGDLQWVVTYMRRMVDTLLPHPETIPDLEYRLASVLEEQAYLLSPDASKQRIPTYDECIEHIRNAVRQVSSPWREQPRLQRLNDAYNAQTMAAWFVPHLIVDPENRWLSTISISGPQVVTGMRGCGKTMLLRALQFHARATITNGEKSSAAVLDRLRNDRYIGLYASATRLLDSVAPGSNRLSAPYTRLLLAYAVEALRAARHLREIDSAAVTQSFFREICSTIAAHVEGAETLRMATSEHEVERQLLEMAVRISRGDAALQFRGHPSSAFPALAEAVCRMASTLWANATVFFLLDDVSTRFLSGPGIQELMSALLFSDPRCAFKLTTENQTLEMILQSPGLIEQARQGRDYDVFDLGAEVNALVRSPGGRRFVEQVLGQRAKFYPHHPQGKTPRAVLGDVSLEAIADAIASSAANSRARKRVYWGFAALAGMCVGDIGDVINLYELMLRRSRGEYPIDPERQSDCYQEYCSRRLYDLHRKSTGLKDHAISFAKASYELLIRSKRDVHDGRLRQYMKLYVRVTVGDTARQFEQLRELIDKGVFVLEGATHRAKTRDGNPVHQFKLTYRKLFGLANFIGLAERDRFELSGEDLIEWLDNPSRGKEILLRNLGGELDLVEQMSLDIEASAPNQPSLFDSVETVRQQAPPTILDAPDVPNLLAMRAPRVRTIGPEVISGAEIDGLVVGLGFEERTLESAKRLASLIRPAHAVLIRYSERGKADEIEAVIRGCVNHVEVVEYADVLRKGLQLGGERLLVDVTGLAKPVIFEAVRHGLRDADRVWICRTKAQRYYPFDDDIQHVLQAERNMDANALLVELAKVFTGESKPYSVDALQVPEGDESRRRLLCAFASPKHERLLTLLDERAYDAVSIVTHKGEGPRSRIAQLAAEVAARNSSGAFVEPFASDDIAGTIKHICKVYEEWYIQRGFNFEFGLTGSKLQTAACAACAAALKVSQVWYVRPQAFDPARFTQGVGDTSYFEICLVPIQDDAPTGD